MQLDYRQTKTWHVDTRTRWESVRMPELSDSPLTANGTGATPPIEEPQLSPMSWDFTIQDMAEELGFERRSEFPR